MGAFTPLYLPRIGVAPADVAAWTGLSVAVSGAVGIPFLPLWGALADRFARRPVIIRSYVAHLLAAAVMVAAGNIWVYVIGRAIMSFSLGNSGLMMTTLAERVPHHRQGMVFSIMNSAAPVGAFLGPLLGGPIVDAWGFPWLLFMDTVLLLGVILMLAFGYHDAFVPSVRDPILRMAADSIRIIWRSPRLRTLFPALFVLFAGWMLAMTYVPLAITALYHGSDPGTVVGVILGAGGLITVILGPAVGMLADRYGQWRMLYAGTALVVVLWPLPALVHSLVAFGITWSVLNGVASGVFALSFAVLAGSAPAGVRGRVMSFAFLPVNVGFTIGPAIGGWITRSSVFAVFPAAAIMTAAGLAALVLAHRRPPEPSGELAPHGRADG